MTESTYPEPAKAVNQETTLTLGNLKFILALIKNLCYVMPHSNAAIGRELDYVII